MHRLKLFDVAYIRCIDNFSTVNVVGDTEAATRASEAFISKYQDLTLGQKIITETVQTNNLPEDQYVLLLSEIEDQHPEVLCQPQYPQQSMVLSVLEQSKLAKAKQHILSFSPGKHLPVVPPRPLHTTPQPTSLRDASLLLPNGGMLTVKRGDLLKEKVTAIVNAANDQLDHIGGVAFAIDRASGGNVQRESRKLIQKSGRVPTGQVAVTGAGGRLQCQSVIHAVGPNANERPHKECEQLLKMVCENVLRTAEAQGMTSVALPAISSGIYAMKKDVVAQILISTILHYPYQHSSPLKDIRIVLFEEETLRPFLQFASEVKQRMPPGTAQRVICVASSPDVVEIPLEKTHRRMVIKKAHFLYEDADIKVAAICSELGFETGYSKELDGHLKGQLSEAVRVRYQYRRPDGFDVFTVHVQHASINCRYLVIVNILDHSLGTRQDAHKCLQQILQAVCQEADTLEMPSVAIAPKTFAVAGFQPECVLPEFIHMLNQFKFTNQEFLTDVRFLALDPDTFDILIAGAERSIGRPLKQPPKHTQALQAPQQPHQPGPAGGRSNTSGHQICKEVTYQPGGTAGHVGQGTPGTGQPPTPANPEEVQQHAPSTFVVYDDVVEIPLEKTHRKMVIKKAHFIYEDADIKVAAICSELGFATGSNKELDGHLKGQLSEAVRVRYQYRRPDRFDVFTVHVQHATFGCRYLVIVNILDHSLGTCQDAHKYLQQILQAVCQEADTLEMPSVVIAPSTFSIGGFQGGSILPAFIRMINDFKFTNDDFLTDVRFLALDQNSFNFLIAGAERHIGKSLRKPVQSSHSTGSYLRGTGTAGAPEQGSQEHSTFSQVQTSTPHPFKIGAHQTGHGVGASTTSAADTRSIPSVSIPFHQGRNLTIKKGNLVEEAVVAIVNSTDEHLQHSSGVAKAINEASGGAVQVVLNDVVVRMGGGAQSGRVVVTAAGGSLRCKHVIHAVWPAAREKPNKGYARLLEELFKEVICIADERQMKSIALPPMTSGSCELSKEMIAQIIIDSILHYPFPVNSLMTDIRIVIGDDETWSPFLKYAVEVKKSHPAACAGSTPSKRYVQSQSHFVNDGPHEWQPSALPGPGHSVDHSTAYLTATPVPSEDMVEIPLEKIHRKMVIKKSHFLHEDTDIKVAAICSELGFGEGVNKKLDDHVKGQLSEAVRGRYQHSKPDRFDVFTVHVQHATISCRYLVIVNILDRSLGSQLNAQNILQQIVQAVCQEADTLEMPSVALATSTFSVGGFQKGSILPAFIRVISHYRFTNEDFFTDVRFVANQNTFNDLIADAERTVGRSLRIPQPPKVANQPLMDPSNSSSSPGPPAPGVGGAPVIPPAPMVGGAPVTPPVPVVGGAPVTPPAPVVGRAPVTPPAPVVGGAPVTPPVPVVGGAPVTPPAPVVGGATVTPPAPVVGGAPVTPPAPVVGGATVTPPAPVVGGAPVTPPALVVGGAPVPPAAPVVGGAPVTPLASDMSSSKDTQLPSPGPGMTKLSEHVFFALVCGDLCKVQADAVVVPVAPSLDVKSGVVQAVDAASGGAISCAVKQIKQTKQTVNEGNAIPVAITSGLNCKQAILLIRNAKGKSEALDHACHEALKLAEVLGARSVTFPPISSNKKKDKLAKSMTGAFASFLPQNSQYAVRVTVVVKENDKDTLKAFRSLAGKVTTDQGIDELPHQMNPDSDKLVTPPDSPSQSHQEPPGLEDDPNATDGPGTAV